MELGTMLDFSTPDASVLVLAELALVREVTRVVGLAVVV